MKPGEVAFSIEEILSSSSRAFREAMQIYLDSTPSSILTNPDEIGHWVDQYEAAHPGDHYKVLLLHRREGGVSQAIGCLQFAFFSKSGLAIVDYICVRKGERGHRAFGCFLERFESYLAEKGFQCRYVVAEVNGAVELAPHGKRAMALVRLLESEGFVTPHVPYFHPALDRDGLSEPAQSPFSLLVISSRCDIDQIGRKEYLEIVSAIYYQHYFRWYAGVYPECAESYRNHLDRLMAKTKFELAGRPDALPIGGCAGHQPTGNKTQRKLPRYLALLAAGVALCAVAALVVSRNFPGSPPWLVALALVAVLIVPLAMATGNERAIFAMASRLLSGLVHSKKKKAGAGPGEKPTEGGVQESK